MERALDRSEEQPERISPESKLNGCGELKFTTFNPELRVMDGALSITRVSIIYLYLKGGPILVLIFST